MSYHVDIIVSARAMRKLGYSLGEISTKFHISKSTASLWTSKEKLTLAVRIRLKKRQDVAREKALKTIKTKTKNLRKKYNKEAIEILEKINHTKIHYQIYCSLLYWAEGGKFMDNHLEFTNSDPTMIKAFIKFLKRGFYIDKSKLRANIHIHEYHNDKRQRKFWQNITKIPLTQFNKSYLKPHTKKIIRKNYQGCVRICYYSADVARKIKSIYTALAKI